MTRDRSRTGTCSASTTSRRGDRADPRSRRDLRRDLERPIKKVPTLRGKTVINLFFEAVDAHAHLVRDRRQAAVGRRGQHLAARRSSTTKGETLLDTARNLEAMAPDVIVAAPRVVGRAALHRRSTSTPRSINAGDGTHEHPTQALLDCATIRQHKGRIDGLTVAIVGDIAHSRVARSDVLRAHASSARACASPGRARMLPRRHRGDGRRGASTRVEPALDGADVVMMLRIQQRAARTARACSPTRASTAATSASAPRLAATLKPDAIVMHPGPINRGVEIDPAVADGARSVILEQVTYGVAVRMALLYLCGGGSSPRRSLILLLLVGRLAIAEAGVGPIREAAMSTATTTRRMAVVIPRLI